MHPCYLFIKPVPRTPHVAVIIVAVTRGTGIIPVFITTHVDTAQDGFFSPELLCEINSYTSNGFIRAEFIWGVSEPGLVIGDKFKEIIRCSVPSPMGDGPGPYAEYLVLACTLASWREILTPYRIPIGANPYIWLDIFVLNTNRAIYDNDVIVWSDFIVMIRAVWTSAYNENPVW